MDLNLNLNLNQYGVYYVIDDLYLLVELLYGPLGVRRWVGACPASADLA